MPRFNFPLALLIITLSIGIGIGNYVYISEFFLWGILAVLIPLLGYVKYLGRYQHQFPYGFSVITGGIMISFGMLLVQLHDPRSQEQHYTHKLPINESSTKANTLQFYIEKRLTPTSHYERYEIQIIALNNQACSGKLLLRVPKIEAPFTGIVGTVYSTVGKLQAITPPRNLGQFDYAAYLKKQYIYHQLTIPSEELVLHAQPQYTIKYYVARIRAVIHQRFAIAGFTPTQLSIINALLLGQRQDINPTLYTAYRDAGALHILAISGLHIGILLWILTYIVKPIHRLGKWGEIGSLLITLSVLWGFAVISGLSISVLRSVLLFSSITIGMQLRSTTSIYNGLMLSAGIILCIQPMALFAVGFQLSYSAVIGIIWIQPILYDRFHSRWYLLQYFWKLISVTLAAQIAILPLTLLYFHQFPILFLLSNILLLPMLGIVLGIGMVCVVGAILEFLPPAFVQVFAYCIEFCNTIVTWVAHHDIAVLTQIPCTLPMALCGYAVIITMIHAFHKQRKRHYRRLKIAVILWCGLLGYMQYTQYQSRVLCIYHQYKTTLISVQEHGVLYPYGNAITAQTIKHIVEPYAVSRGVVCQSIQPLQEVYRYDKQLLLIVGKDGVYPNVMAPDIVLLSNAPKLHLDRLIDSIHPKRIIADGSTYPTLIHQWKVTCDARKIPFHNTNDGSVLIHF